MLFTGEQKRTIWDRLAHGRSGAEDKEIGHIMKGHGTLTQYKEYIDERYYNQASAAYRLVKRHLITTRTEFVRVSAILTRSSK
jgi:hypothetical protein